MVETAAQTAEPPGRAVQDRAAVTPPEHGITAGCPQWCTNGPHEDAHLRAWRDGEASVVHEAYLLRQENAEMVLEQLAHILSSRETDRSRPPSLYVHIEQEISCPETASRLASALLAAARLVAQLGEPLSQASRFDN